MLGTVALILKVLELVIGELEEKHPARAFLADVTHHKGEILARIMKGEV